MTTLEQRIQVDRSVGDCFRYLLDFSTIEQWDPGVYRATKKSPGAPQEGSIFDITLSTMGRQLPMRYEIVEIYPAQRIILTGNAKGIRARDTIDFRPLAGDGCEIHYRADLEFDGLLNVATPLARPWLERIGRKAVEGLRVALSPPGEVIEMSLRERLKYRAVLPAAWDFTQRGYLQMPRKGLSEFIDGQTAVITGPTSGLGLASAKLLARLGGRLILVGRNDKKLSVAKRDIQAFSGCDARRLQIVEADLSEMAQVKRAADELRSISDEIDILINNAGALFDERRETSEGHERTLAINLLCPFVLTTALMDRLAYSGGRVINVASGGMYTQGLDLDDLEYESAPFDGPTAYARAKRGLVALTDHWAAHYPASQITFNAMHPGWADTAGVKQSLPRFYRTMKPRLRDARMGADTIVWLATSDALTKESGRFFFDRRPRPKSVLPGTSVSPSERETLVAWLGRHLSTAQRGSHFTVH